MFFAAFLSYRGCEILKLSSCLKFDECFSSVTSLRVMNIFIRITYTETLQGDVSKNV